ncbi:extracellular solute-binding protein [Microbacterium trichothecenolyticum]|uniref:extracellular solute-binding protein n=1 Tax=Microbacterium trichothecenolyticum TaxID=69370 RepID=UPI0035BE2EC6
MPSHPRFRRLALSGLAAGAAFALLTGCAGSPAPADGGDSTEDAISGQIIWADFGGPTNESRQVAYFDGFYDETGVEVVSTSIEDAVYYSQLEGDQGDYDTFQVSTRDLVGYPDHVVEIPEEAQGDMVPEQYRPYVLGGFYIGVAQGWLTETFPDGGPQDWADFFDTEKFPGKRAWPGAPSSFDASYEIALLADGVDPDDLYPMDIERATAKLDTIRGDLVFYQAYPEVQQLLSSGSASIAVSVTGQFTALSRAGMDVTVQWNQAFQSLNGFVLPDTSNNPEAVKALAIWINDPANQAVFTERTLYGPVNSAVFDELPEDVQDDVVNAPSHDAMIEWDEVWRGENRDLLLNSYTEWLAG